MTAPEEILNEVVNYLLSCESLKEYKIIHAFPSRLKQSPLKKITLTCCIDKTKLSHVRQNKKDVVLSQADILITIHIPPQNGGEESEAICGKISRELFFSSSFNIKSLECGKLSYRRETDSFTVPVTVSIEKYERGGEDLPDTPLDGAVIESDGKAAANAELSKIKAFRSGKPAAGEREDYAFGAVLGVINYRIELSGVTAIEDFEKLKSLTNFTLRCEKNGKTISYGGCEWLELEESFSDENYMIEEAVIFARSCDCEEAEA